MTNIRQLFSNISGTYDLLNKVLSFGTDKKWRKKGVGLLPHANHVKILDLASGTLNLSLEYTRQGAGEVYALDFSLPMLLTGHTKVSPTLDKRLHLICGDFRKLMGAMSCRLLVAGFPKMTRPIIICIAPYKVFTVEKTTKAFLKKKVLKFFKQATSPEELAL